MRPVDRLSSLARVPDNQAASIIPPSRILHPPSTSPGNKDETLRYPGEDSWVACSRSSKKKFEPEKLTNRSPCSFTNSDDRSIARSRLSLKQRGLDQFRLIRIFPVYSIYLKLYLRVVSN